MPKPAPRSVKPFAECSAVTTRRTVISGLCGVGAFCWAGPAWAHRLARTESDVTISQKGDVSIVHVYHLQDAQSALFQAGLIDRPDLGSLRARAQLALYTEANFTLAVSGTPVALDLIGAEIQGDSAYVYQEGHISDGALSIDARMLRSLLKGQSNSVNIVRDGQTVTLDFSGDDGPKPVA